MPKPHPQVAIGCTWITGDPGEPGWFYCQKRIMKAATGPWCKLHHSKVYRPATVVRADTAAYRKAQREKGQPVDAKRMTFGSF